jgi:gliding motility-associated lipoprotein GldH
MIKHIVNTDSFIEIYSNKLTPFACLTADRFIENKFLLNIYRLFANAFPRFNTLLCSFLMLLCAIYSCNPNRIYEKNIDIPGYVWNTAYKPSFEVEITDTHLIYRISVNIRHTNFYQYSNLWVMAYTSFPDGKTISQRVELPLADKEGKWYGSCLGDICDLNITIQERAYFNQTGKHSFTFEQIMRDKDLNIESLPAIMAIGLRIDKVGERSKQQSVSN